MKVGKYLLWCVVGLSWGLTFASAIGFAVVALTGESLESLYPVLGWAIALCAAISVSSLSYLVLEVSKKKVSIENLKAGQ